MNQLHPQSIVTTTQNNLRVYYEPTTGKLRGHDNGDLDDPPMQEGIEWIAVPVGQAPDAKTMVVDLENLQIRKTAPEERRVLNAPGKIEIQVLRRLELLETDWRESQPAWAIYRQALRDITDAGDGLSMIDAWPLRPDGTDAAALLKMSMK